jgi:ABC-2 type transport system ATP-binding protein
LFAVEVSKLEKRFGRRRRPVAALSDVSFTIDRRECVAVLGQNGSGKSTLVRVLSTLLLPEGGHAAVFGHDVVRDAAAVRRLVNRVSVEASFFKRMSALENLSYAARFYGLTPKVTRVRIPEILERVGFPGSRSGEPMEDLSRGMQQKVALARALLTSPVLLLLDEPTTGVDAATEEALRKIVRELVGSGLPVLMSTHDLDRVDDWFDRLLVLDRRVLALGTPREVVESGAYSAIREHTHTHGHLRHDHEPHAAHAAHPEIRS